MKIIRIEFKTFRWSSGEMDIASKKLYEKATAAMVDLYQEETTLLV